MLRATDVNIGLGNQAEAVASVSAAAKQQQRRECWQPGDCNAEASKHRGLRRLVQGTAGAKTRASHPGPKPSRQFGSCSEGMLPPNYIPPKRDTLPPAKETSTEQAPVADAPPAPAPALCKTAPHPSDAMSESGPDSDVEDHISKNN